MCACLRVSGGIETPPEETSRCLPIRGGTENTDDHTLAHFKSEFWFPTLIDRNRRERWEAKGRTRMSERAQARIIEILDSHKPAPLPAAAQRKIREVLAEADGRFRSRQY